MDRLDGKGMNMKKGLVLEGGAMRGIYTAGVLDAFLEQNITVDGVIGVSAGAVHGCSYVSGQHGRSIRYYLKYMKNPRFMSFRSLLKTGNLVETEFSYHELPDRLDVFDRKAFAESPMDFYVGCTNVETGKPEYILLDTMDEIDYMRASASMPMVSQIVEVGGMKLLDGGVADSVPIRAFQQMGYEKNIVVLTRPAGYRKKKSSIGPAWSMMAKKLFPEQAKCISMALTPMVLTARLIKQQNPDCKIVFVGPCAAKKLEASRKTIRSYVDFVLTFEELHGMFDAKGVDFKELPDGEPLMQASADGRGFAASGGVASAVVNAIRRMEPNREVKVVSAEGLANCKKMLQLAKAGKYNGYLLEGMACPGGCIAGAGTIQPIKKTAASLEQMKKQAPFEESMDTVYDAMLPILEKL